MAKSAQSVLSEFQLNNQWICENYESLKIQFNNQWVAVVSKAVVDHDPDLKKLLKRLKTHQSKVYSQIAVEYVTSEELEPLNESRPQS